MIRIPHRPRSDASIELSEIDTGIRQCLQLLMSSDAIKDCGPDIAREYWMKIAERAWRDFEEDRAFVQRQPGKNDEMDFG